MIQFISYIIFDNINEMKLTAWKQIVNGKK